MPSTRVYFLVVRRHEKMSGRGGRLKGLHAVSKPNASAISLLVVFALVLINPTFLYASEGHPVGAPAEDPGQGFQPVTTLDETSPEGLLQQTEPAPTDPETSTDFLDDSTSPLSPPDEDFSEPDALQIDPIITELDTTTPIIVVILPPDPTVEPDPTLTPDLVAKPAPMIPEPLPLPSPIDAIIPPGTVIGPPGTGSTNPGGGGGDGDGGGGGGGGGPVAPPPGGDGDGGGGQGGGGDIVPMIDIGGGGVPATKPLPVPIPGDIGGPLPPNGDDRRQYYDRTFGTPTPGEFTADGPMGSSPGRIAASRNMAQSQPGYFDWFTPGMDRGLGGYLSQRRAAWRKKYLQYEGAGEDFRSNLRDLYQLNVPLLVEYLDQKALSDLLNQGGQPVDNSYAATTSTDVMKTLAAAYALVLPENISERTLQPFVQMVVYKSVTDPLHVKAFLFLRVLTEKSLPQAKAGSSGKAAERLETPANPD